MGLQIRTQPNVDIKKNFDAMKKDNTHTSS